MSEFTFLPKKERLILSILRSDSKSQLYGLEILKASKNQIVRGTLYTTLQRMEDKGLISSVEEDEIDETAGIYRRRYFITGLGQRALDAAEYVETGVLPAPA